VEALLLSRRCKLLAFIFLLAAAAVIVGLGSDRMPADPTRPLVLEGEVQYPSLSGPSFRIGTFNIHGGRGTDGRRDLSRIARCLTDLDLVALQEVHGSLMGHHRSQVALLGREINRAWLFAPTERRWWHDHFGNGLLTRVALTGHQCIPLAGTRGDSFRNALLAVFRYRDRRVKVLLTHIDRHEDRQSQLEAVIGLFLSLQEPAVLLGDLNTPAPDPRLQALLATPGVRNVLEEILKDRLPEGNIDWIFTRGLEPITAGWVPPEASDHPLVWAELSIPARKN